MESGEENRKGSREKNWTPGLVAYVELEGTCASLI